MRIGVWTAALATASGRQLADTEPHNRYYHLHTFFAVIGTRATSSLAPAAVAQPLTPSPTTGKTPTFIGRPRAATTLKAANSLPAMPTKTSTPRCGS